MVWRERLLIRGYGGSIGEILNTGNNQFISVLQTIEDLITIVLHIS
jgi:hypothetical protein